MTTIKALKTFSDGAISLHEGEIANVPDVKAQLFINAGYAVEYTGEGGDIDLSAYVKKSDIVGVYKDKKAIAFGTSITYRCANFENNGYIGVAKNRLALNSYINKGLDGNPIAYGTPNGNGIGNYIENTNISTYDLITIEGGTNDFKLNVEIGEVGKMGDTNFDKTTMCGALRSAIEYIYTNNPTAKILIITDPQRNNSNYDVNNVNSAGYKLIDYVNAMLEIASLYGITVCDLYRTSGINSFTFSTFLSDGLHPNAVGYERIGELVTNSLVGNTVVLKIDSDSPTPTPTPTPSVDTVTIDSIEYDISNTSGYTYKMIMNLGNKLYLYLSNNPFKIDDTNNAEMCKSDAIRMAVREDNSFNKTDGINPTSNMTAVDDYFKSTQNRTLSQYLWTSHDIQYYTSGDIAVAKSNS